MNFPTLAALAVVLILLGLDILYLMKNKGSGCSGSCSSCGSVCKWTDDLEKAKHAIRSERVN